MPMFSISRFLQKTWTRLILSIKTSAPAGILPEFHDEIIPKSLISIWIKVFGDGWSDLEDLAFGFRSSREVDRVDLGVCLSEASYAAAEKAGRRMALKIWTERSHPQRPILIPDFNMLTSIINFLTRLITFDISDDCSEGSSNIRLNI